jgi:hypothetical protein|tara:strand:- start:4846 stop:5829 length:984 start_codon:yes stop_codon:yes gene_type:complete
MTDKNYSKTTLKSSNPHKLFYCEICDYTSSNNSNYNKHLRTKKHLANTGGKSIKWQRKTKAKYFNTCDFCNYNASKKYNWDKHIRTAKHKQKVAKSGNEVAEEVFGENVVIDSTFDSHSDVNRDKLEMLAEQMNIITSTLNKVVDNTHHTTINNNQTTNNISINLFLDKYCHNAQSLQDFVDNVTFKLNDILNEDNLIEDFVSRKMLKNLSDMPVTERPIHCTDQKRRNFFVKDKNEGWVKDIACNEINSQIYHTVNQLHKRAYLDFYSEYDKLNPLPHDPNTENIKCKISSELLKPPSKIDIHDIAKTLDIRDALVKVGDDEIPDE